MKKISVVTTTFNNPDLLRNLLESFTSDCIDMFDIVVVDDKSNHDTFAEIQIHCNAYGARLYQIKESPAFGSHVCRNIGAREAQCEFILFIDADTFLSRRCLYGIVDKPKFHEDELYMFYTNIFVNMIDRKDGIQNYAPMPSASQKFYNKYYQYNIDNNNHMNFFIVSKKNFISVGGYDEELFFIREGDRLIQYKLLEYLSLKRVMMPGQLNNILLGKEYKNKNNIFKENVRISAISAPDYVKVINKVISKKLDEFKFIVKGYVHVIT